MTSLHPDTFKKHPDFVQRCFAKEFMKEPYGVASVGLGLDENREACLNYTLSAPLVDGVTIPVKYMGLKTVLRSVNKPMKL